MGKPLPMELRRRVVDFVEEGHTHRAAAAQFRVSVKFVNDMVLLKRATGSLAAPLCQGCCPLLYFSVIFRWAG